MLDRQDFGAACASRDLGEMLRIAVKWGGPGFSASHVARRCEMTVSQVTDYTKRGRQATKLEVFARVADGLHVPGHMLGITRRPWEDKNAEYSRDVEGLATVAVTGAYSGRGSITRRQWNEVIEGASEHIWLYGMAEFGYATDDEVPGIFADVTARGCQVKILLLDPEHGGVESIDADEGGPSGTLSARIRASLIRFRKMQGACGENFEIRIYNAHPDTSIVRGDGTMIVTPYLRFYTGSNSPTFEFRSDSAGKIFERYEQHFDHAWTLAKDWT
ncbi:MAG TPA: DUF5919 domain-containing protein [Streptosporangiaceae bacterium]